MSISERGIRKKGETMIEKSRKIELLTPPIGKVRAILDTDAFNEVDDQFALAYALNSPDKINLEAVYAAPFFNGKVANEKEGMEKSYEEIQRIITMLNRTDDVKAIRGATEILKETAELSGNEAACDMVNRAKISSDPLYIISIGALTNVATAIMLDPSILFNIVIVWLGGHPHYWPHTWEFNLKGDVRAAQVVFDSGAALIQIPCMGVASNLTTTEYELLHCLMGKSKIGSYLTELICAFSHEDSFYKEYNGIVDKYLRGTADYDDNLMGKPVYSSDNYAYSKIIWDIAAVAYLINPTWVHTSLVDTPEITADFQYKERTKKIPMRIGNYIKRDCVFGDLFHALRDK
jgi:inosine-uridine nucleoside N-ribohydrolase